MDGSRSLLKLYTVVKVENGHPSVITYQGFWHMIKSACEDLGWSVLLQDYRKAFPEPRTDLTGGMRFSQERLVRDAVGSGMSGLIGAPTRYGKCLGENEHVLMGCGVLTKAAKDVLAGDFVMGSDSQPKKVLAVCAGSDVMYQITPNKGDPWVCTQDHVLVLQCTDSPKFGGYKKGARVHVRLCDYLGWSKTRKHVFKQVQASLELPEQSVPFDPYIVGAFLGESCLGKPTITCSKVKKTEVSKAIQDWALKLGERISLPKSAQTDVANVLSGTTPLVVGLGLTAESVSHWQAAASAEGKTIPACYLRNSRAVRLQVLAGILDTAGNLKNHAGVEIATKYETLRDTLSHLCRSLGFRTTWTEKWVKLKSWTVPRVYYRFSISGNIDEIPFKTPRFKNQLKLAPKKSRPNPLTTGFKVTCLGLGNYAGMQIEGETQEFVMGNFTITHNSRVLINIARCFPDSNIVITAPGKDLVRQLFSEAKLMLSPRPVKMLGGGKNSSRIADDGVLVCSTDSLHKVDKDATDVLITDEPHAVATDTRIPQFNAFTRARRYGLGATLTGRFDNRDKIIEGLIGPVLTKVTYKEAVAEGAICPIEVVLIKYTFDPWPCSWFPQALSRVYHKNNKVAALTRYVCDNLIPPDWQTLLFVKNEEHAEFMSHSLSGCKWPVAMAKLLTSKERNTLTDEVKNSVHKRVICSDIYSQGMTFSDVRCLINLSGGGPYTSTIQKPGRLAEIRPDIGKTHGLLVDFMPVPTYWPTTSQMKDQVWRALTQNADARLEEYKTIGYGIHTVENPGQLNAVMKSLVL